MQHLPYQRGITLIEVLVAVLIFSIGLLGVAGLLVMSVRSNHAAYLRTQVTFLAQSMADRMQANPIGVWSGDYNGRYPIRSAQACDGGCRPKQRALHDQGVWSSQLQTFLPAGAQATIACSQTGLPYMPSSDQIALQPPYGGSCKMTMSWTELGAGFAATGDSDRSLQTFAWEFQP
jgi:type IV pilus assembly protein PilV